MADPRVRVSASPAAIRARDIHLMERPTTAHENGLASIYHYTVFNETRLADILTNHRVFCSDPATFNDPWDCKPYFDPDVVDDPEEHAKLAERIIEGQPGGAKGDLQEQIIRGNPNVVKALIHRFSAGFEKVVSDRWRIFCVSASPTSALMWSHYSDKHRGICLEFGTDNAVFGSAARVEYLDEYPKLKIFGKQEATIGLLLAKSCDWNYEQEYRLICPRSTNEPDHPLRMEGDYVPIPAGALKSIIVGCQGDWATVEEFVKRFAPGPPARKAIRSLNRYLLNIMG